MLIMYYYSEQVTESNSDFIKILGRGKGITIRYIYYSKLLQWLIKTGNFFIVNSW